MATFVGSDSGFSVYEGSEILQVEAWGENSARVRSTLRAAITETPGSALGETPPGGAQIEIADDRAVMRNGALVVEVATNGGREFFLQAPPLVRFLRSNGEELFGEHVPHFASPPQRRYTRGEGGLHHCEVTFNASRGERIYGLGQHQHGLFDQKGAVIDLIQRNTEVCVPFVLSNRGYGFLWNMPGTGRVELGTNHTRWAADALQVDYWVTAGDTPAEIVSRYSGITGLPPVFPYWGSGFWQCKLRYRTQDELLDVAREHKRRGLPLSVIVVDYFHWTRQGEWKFDLSEWPDPQAMVDELRALGVEGDLEAVIGPGAGGCCYETGDEVRELFAAHGVSRARLLDLKAVAAEQLREAGVAAVRDVDLCTICAPRGRFFSHRRDGAATGRQGGFAWLA